MQQIWINDLPFCKWPIIANTHELEEKKVANLMDEGGV